MLSIWQKQTFSSSTDIIIVGAGLTGLLSAIRLKEQNSHLSIRILEKGLIPSGASIKNAGFACFGSVSEILDDIQNEGEDKAYTRVVERYRGLQMLFDTVDPKSVDLERHGGVEIFTESEQEILGQSLDHLVDLNSALKTELGFKPFSVGKNNYGLKALDKVIHIQEESTLHSGKLIQQLLLKARHLGIEVHFGVEVLSLEQSGEGWAVQSHSGALKSSRVLLATNGFTPQLLPSQSIIPARGQIVMTSKIPGLNLMGSFHLHQGYFYFREYEGAVLLGGGRHLDRSNENTTDQNTSNLIQQALEKILREVILPGKEFEIEHRWAGTMAFGPKNEKDAIVEEPAKNLFVAARLGGMGVAMSSHVAKMASSLILK